MFIVFSFKDHKIRRHSAGKVICKNCKRPFENQFDFDKHKLSCFKKSKLTVCPICGRQFNRNGSVSTLFVFVNKGLTLDLVYAKHLLWLCVSCILFTISLINRKEIGFVWW